MFGTTDIHAKESAAVSPWRRRITSIAATAALAATGTVATGSSASAAPAWYCKVVVALDITVWASPETSTLVWGSWGYGTKFLVDRKDGSKDRYHTWWPGGVSQEDGYDAWVTSDSRWVQPATGCV